MSILDTIPFLESLSPEDKNHLSYFCQEKSMVEGEELVHQGDEPTAFYIVTDGSFGVFKESDGSTQELGPIQSGDILGEMALFGQDEVRNATVIAKEDSTVVTILDFSIKELTKNNPDLLKKIQDIIKERS